MNLSSDISLKLGEQHGLKVMHSDAAKDLKQPNGIDFDAAHKMGLTHLLSGSLKRDNEELSLEVDLVDISKQKSVWSKVYQKKMQDLLLLKDELASDILQPLALEENTFYDTKDAAVLPRINEDVLRQYLTAQQAMHNETAASIREAITYLDDCIDRDSSLHLVMLR